MEFVGGAQPAHDITYSEAFLVPRYSDINSRMDVELYSLDGIPAAMPVVGANMRGVAGKRMCETLARRGSFAVLHQDFSDEKIAKTISHVKNADPVYDTAITLEPSTRISEAQSVLPKRAHLAAYVMDGNVPVGVLEAKDIPEGIESTTRVQHVMREPVLCMPDGLSPREMYAWLQERPLHVAPVLGKTGLRGVMSLKGAVRTPLYKPAVDTEGRLLVAAAVGINGNPGKRAARLVELGADVIVVDTAHGHQRKMLDAVKEVRDQVQESVIIAAGNVVTADGTLELLEAGADIAKVGVGPGAMCTTRVMTGVGRPQLSAVLECAQAASKQGGHIWADGGVRHPRDVVLAMAAGAARVMVGSWFSATYESPPEIQVDKDGREYKVNFGMASQQAVIDRNDKLDRYDAAQREMFDEGISKSRMYLDKEAPSVEDLLDKINAGLRSAMTYTGARTLDEFRDKALVGIQSLAGFDEGKPLPTGW